MSSNEWMKYLLSLVGIIMILKQNTLCGYVQSLYGYLKEGIQRLSTTNQCDMKKPFYSSKEFVNLPGYNSDASIFTQVMFYSDDSSGYDATLKLRDCGNSVHYAIGLGDEGDRSYENSLFKIDVLIGELTKFREAMVKAKEIYDERSKAEEAEREERRKQNDDEVDPGPHNSPSRSGVSDPTTHPVRGLEGIQAAIFTAPNL